MSIILFKVYLKLTGEGVCVPQVAVGQLLVAALLCVEHQGAVAAVTQVEPEDCPASHPDFQLPEEG